MTSQTKNIIIAVLVLIVLAGCWTWGYFTYPKFNPKPVTQVDTIIKIDTVVHHIVSKIPYYISKTDTIIIRDTVLSKVDTTAILIQFYAWHIYQREWKDSILLVTLRDVVSENKVYDSDFNYKILRPTEVINKTEINYSYSKYLFFGGRITLPDSKWSDLSVYFASNQFLAGIGYIPYQRGVSATIALKLAKFK